MTGLPPEVKDINRGVSKRDDLAGLCETFVRTDTQGEDITSYSEDNVGNL